MELNDRKVLVQLTESTGRTIYVARDHITSIYEADEVTHVETVRSRYVVKETPRQIFNLQVFLVAIPPRVGR